MVSIEYVNQRSLVQHTGGIFFSFYIIQGHLMELIPITQKTKKMTKCIHV